jgi:hypothetical protein
VVDSFGIQFGTYRLSSLLNHLILFLTVSIPIAFSFPIESMSPESDDDQQVVSLFMAKASIMDPNDSDDDNNRKHIDSCFEMQQRLSSSPNCVASATRISNLQQHSVPRTDGTESAPWPVYPMSSKARRTHNPIRAIVDPVLSSMDHGNNDKPRISLAVSDYWPSSPTSSLLNGNEIAPSLTLIMFIFFPSFFKYSWVIQLRQ